MSTTARSPRPVRLWLMIAALVALAVVRAAGATTTAPRVEGTYILDPAASDDVLKAIDGVVAEMSSFKAPFARRRLRTLNQPPKRIEVASSDSDVSITTDERETNHT